jgi:HK97 gp10 family phage protein
MGVAKAYAQMPEEFLAKISALGSKTDEIVPRVLEAGAEVVQKRVKSNLTAALSGKSSGQLASALGVSPAKVDRNGNMNVKIGFAENRSDGKSNAMLAGVLEYGKHNQPPRPFLKPAKSAAKAECVETMKAALEREIDSL